VPTPTEAKAASEAAGKDIGAPRSKDAPVEAPATPAEAPKGQSKANPWKLVDTYKQKAKSLEIELEQHKAKLADPELITNLNKKLEAIEARNKELESHIRYKDFEKSEEFRDQFQKPIDEAWDAARWDLAELSVANADGTSRQASVEDLAMLANMRLQEAKAKAVEMFGDLADEVMGHRRKILELSRKQSERLEKAKKESVDYHQKETLAEQTFRREVVELNEKINARQLQQLDFLQPKEGDAEFNERLQTAREFVEGTLGSSIKDKNLTREQRAELVERMVTVKNRAIGFSAMKLEVSRLKAQLAEKDKIIARFQQGEPGPGNGRKAADTASAGDPRATLHSAFDRAADLATYR